MQPHGRRAGPAVEQERERAVGRVFRLGVVADVEDVRLGLARLVLHDHLPGGGAVGDRLAVAGDGAGGDRRVLRLAAGRGGGEPLGVVLDVGHGAAAGEPAERDRPGPVPAVGQVEADQQFD